ncbi:MAG: patatin-like phospholipase family protein, partial [Bacteroidaceae bacterium]
SIPYIAVATNMQNDQEVVFSRGSLHDAIRASISSPFLFIPFKRDGMILVDGGISNPLPLSRIKRQEGDLLVAVVACTPKKDVNVFRCNKFALLMEAMISIIQRMVQISITQYKPDVVIQIPTRKYNMFNLKNSRELIKEGALATRNSMASCERNGN